MSVNKYQDHLVVIAEDDACRAFYNGFMKTVSVKNILALQNAGGWLKAVEACKQELGKFNKYRKRHLLLIIDFDGKSDRRTDVWQNIPAELKNRVFVLGSFQDPETLRKQTKLHLEEIGATLADGCPEQFSELWQHDLLQHNLQELERMQQCGLLKSLLS